MKILILCTGNSCRSQMAEGFLKSFNNKMEVYSAGTKPASQVHINAIKAMADIGIDISKNKPENVSKYLNMSFDYVISVCGGAKESCPTFIGKVKNRLHIGFEDPDEVTGTEEEILSEFIRIRNEILVDFFRFYNLNIESN